MGSNGGKPIIKYNMILGSDGSCFKVQHQRRGAGVDRGESHQLAQVGTSLPTRYLLAILQLLLESVDWASKHMQIVELGLWEPGLGEYIMRGKTGC